MKEDSKLKRQRCTNQQKIDIAKDYPDIELNDQSHEIMEKLCYLGDSIGARRVAVDNVLTRIRSGWSNLRDLVLW